MTEEFQKIKEFIEENQDAFEDRFSRYDYTKVREFLKESTGDLRILKAVEEVKDLISDIEDAVYKMSNALEKID